jgi:hypothetical protein
MFKPCHEVTLQNGDKCEVGQYVIAKTPDQLGTTVIAHVEEVLSIISIRC